VDIKRHIEVAKEINSSISKKCYKSDFMDGESRFCDSENITLAIDIFDTIENYHSGDFIAGELEPLVDFLNDSKKEIWLEIDGMEFHIISESAIDEIYQESFKEMVEDCYDIKPDNFPGFLIVNIDWEASADYVQQCDGYGNHFASYDGEELESSGYYIFRTS